MKSWFQQGANVGLQEEAGDLLVFSVKILLVSLIFDSRGGGEGVQAKSKSIELLVLEFQHLRY